MSLTRGRPGLGFDDAFFAALQADICQAMVLGMTPRDKEYSTSATGPTGVEIARLTVNPFPGEYLFAAAELKDDSTTAYCKISLDDGSSETGTFLMNTTVTSFAWQIGNPTNRAAYQGVNTDIIVYLYSSGGTATLRNLRVCCGATSALTDYMA